MTASNNYKDSIMKIHEETELSNEIPNIYSDSYKDAVIASLMKEKEYCKTSRSYGYIQFSCLVDMFREHGEIFDMVSSYMKFDEEDEQKSSFAVKIADSLVKSASLYYREDIEDDVKKLTLRGICDTPY